MNKADIRNIALLAPILYLYQNIFLWSKNVSMFTNLQLAYSFGLILIVSALCYFIFYYLLSFLYAKIKYSKWLQLGIGVFVAVFIGIVSNFCFLRTIFYPYHHFAMYSLIIGIVLIVYFNVSRHFLKFCCILVLFASCTFAYNIYKDRAAIIADSDKYFVEFKDKPNIYMFWLESFQGARTLKDVYNVDISPLTEFLEENNFTVCENVFSTSHYTLASMTDLFSLGTVHVSDFSVGVMDAFSSVRELIGGGNGNNVLKTLKYNGYVTNFICRDFYLFIHTGKYLDYSNVDSYASLMSKLYPCFLFSKYGKTIFDQVMNSDINRTDLLNDFVLPKLVKEEIDKMQQLECPYFLAFKGGVFHIAENGPYTDEDKAKWVETGGYGKAVKENIFEIQEIISMILEKDPNALIVLLGDHGAYIHRSNLHNNIPIKSFADDYFNVYGAVRLPKKYAKFSFDDKEIYINHSNIFVHIFSLLAQDPNYLNLQTIPISKYWGKQIIIENGIVNENVEFEK